MRKIKFRGKADMRYLCLEWQYCTVGNIYDDLEYMKE